MRQYPIYIGGKEFTSSIVTESTCVYSQEKFAEVSLANPEHIEQAIEIGHKAKNSMKKLSAYQKREILLECRDLFKENRSIFISLNTKRTNLIKRKYKIS